MNKQEWESEIHYVGGIHSGWNIVKRANGQVVAIHKTFLFDPFKFGDVNRAFDEMNEELEHVNAPAPRVMRRYLMQDRSGGKINRADPHLSLQKVLEMTDYSEDEVDQIACLEVGQELLIGAQQDLYIKRTL